MNLTVPHTLGKDEATARLNHFLERIQEKYESEVSELHQQWDGDALDFRFRTYGINIKGRIAVGEDKLDFNGELPIAAMMFKGKIESGIRDALTRAMK
jgi:putative polyhydroxyalkanoate system protein